MSVVGTALHDCHVVDNQSVAVTLLIDGVPSDRLQFAASPLAELGSLLHLMTDADHHVPFRDVAARLRQGIPADLAAELDALSPLWFGYRARVLYPLRVAAGRSADEELQDLHDLDADRFLEATAWAIRGGHSGAPSVGELETAGGRRELLQRARSRGMQAQALAEACLADPAAVRTRLLGFLERAHAELNSRWRLVAGTLSVEAQLRQRMAGRHGVAAALTGLTPVSRMLENPARVVFDKLHRGIIDLRRDHVLALPSVHSWPHMLVKHEPGWIPLIQYPIGPTAAHQEVTSPEVLRRRLAVLADPSRLRVCRLVAREPLSTSEIARRTGMSAPQASRMLRPLRENGLLLASRNGHFVLYRLDIEAVTQLGSDLLAALLR
jgi:DNA-binding transcriptional ArsR family regulator